MKKKLLFLTAAFALFVPSVLAAKPTYDMTISYGEGKSGVQFFANGTSIVIEKRTDGNEGALIKWTEDGTAKELLVSEYSSVFGGSHDSTEKISSTSITMNGGKLRNIFGGGLHKSYVVKSLVTINDGNVAGVQGGGASSYAKSTCHRPWFAMKANKEDATTVVEEANVIINGGTISSAFAGGEGISYTKNANITLNKGNVGYLSGSGSNGYTDTAVMEVNGGTTEVMQGVNRGLVENVDMTINGGTINNLYAGAEASDDDINNNVPNNELGRVNDAFVTIYGGTIENVSAGYYGGTSTSQNDDLEYALVYNEDVDLDLDNSGFKEDNVVTTVVLSLMFDDIGEDVQIPKGTVFTDEELKDLIDEINELIEDDDLKLEGFYLDSEFKNKFDFKTPIDKNITLYLKLVELNSGVVTPPSEEEGTKGEDNTKNEEVTKEEVVENPKTSDMNLELIIATIGIASLGAVVASKKRMAKVNR